MKKGRKYKNMGKKEKEKENVVSKRKILCYYKYLKKERGNF